MSLADLAKTPQAIKELADKGNCQPPTVTEPGKGAGLEVETLLAEIESIR